METPQSNGNQKLAGLSNQLITVIVVSLGMMNAGMMEGWMSPMTKILRDPDSPVGPLSTSELGFVASLSFYVKFVIGFLTSYLANRFGRKSTLIIAGIPSILGGALLTVANNKALLYIGRGLTGFTMVSISLGPMYLSETVQDSIRGTLITFANLSISFGILITYSAFKFLGYKTVNYLLTAVPVIYFVTFFFLPETPFYLASKSRDKAALKSLSWLRGGDAESTSADMKTIESGRKDETLSLLRSFKSKEAKSALLIGVTLFAIQTLSGIHIILNFAEMIFSQTKSPVSPDTAAILVPMTILIATVACLLLVDKVGRKPLLYVSLVVGFISHLALCVLLFLHAKGHSFTYIGTLTVVSVTIFVFSYGAGLGGVPAIVLNEVASVEIKSYVATVAVLNAVILIIGVLQLFPILTESVGIYVNFIVPMLTNFFGFFYVRYCVPETKGKSLSEITNLLKGR